MIIITKGRRDNYNCLFDENGELESPVSDDIEESPQRTVMVLKLMSNISKGGERYTTVTSIRNTQEKLI
jgi:hypothetical protein